MHSHDLAATYVIPCSGAKLDRPATAREMYTGSMFGHTLASAVAMVARDGGRILVLSARYGLVELDQVLVPYECRMTDADAVSVETITAQAVALGIEWGGQEISALLPAAYFARLDQALRALDVYAQNVYEAAPGIGYQHRTNKNAARDWA